MKQTTPNKYEAQIEQWTGLVWHIVNKIKGRLPFSVSEEELYAAGMFGLMRAARSYDESQGAQFKTYAYHRVRGAILDDLRRMDFLPRSIRDKAKETGEMPKNSLITLITVNLPPNRKRISHWRHSIV
jgi:RNA polymerase sigma factor for flagellar operon FliA